MKLFKKSLMVLIATIAAYGLAFIYHPIIGRLLGPADYGLFSVANSLVYFISLPLIAVTILVPKHAAKLDAKKQYGKIKSLLIYFIKKQAVYGVIALALFILLNNLISNLLGGGLSSAILALSFTIPFTYLVVVFRSYAQGRGFFKLVSIGRVVDPLTRILFGILLISLGLGVFGAVLALMFPPIITILLFMPFIYKIFSEKSRKIKDIKFGGDSLKIILTNIFINSIMLFDVFFVKTFLGAEIVGLYSSASNISKALFIGFTSVLTVFFPEIVKSYTLKNKKELISKYKYAIFYTAIISFIAVAGFALFPELIIGLLYGSEFTSASAILVILAFNMLFYSLSIVNLQTLWAMSDYYKILVGSLILFLLDIGLLYYYVPALGVMAAAVITTITHSLLFASSLFLVIKKIRKA